MSIYIISNRRIRAGKFVNRGGRRGISPEFRIAKCFDAIDDDGRTIKDTMDYEIISDGQPADYEKVIEALDGSIEPNKLVGSEYMFYDLYNEMSSDPGNSDVLFFIHGFANSFSDNLEHIFQLKQLYLNEASTVKHLVYLSWPSSNHIYGTYWKDQTNARETGMLTSRVFMKLKIFFEDIFEIHKRRRCLSRVHLVTHSMGSKVLEYAVNSIPPDAKFPLFSEILLLYSDVANDIFESGKGYDTLMKLGSRINIYFHRNDLALVISRNTKTFNSRLGRTGPSSLDDLPDNCFVIDTSGVSDSGTKKDRLVNHWLYLYSPTVIDDIIYMLNNESEEKNSNRERNLHKRNYFYLKD